MPAPYSIDLRRKAVSAYEQERGTQQEIAHQFGIALRTLKEWIFIKKETGDIQPKEHVHRGKRTIIDEKGLSFIQKLVEKKPDIIIPDIREAYLRKFKIKIAQSMVSRAFKKLNLRRKKKSEYAIEQERHDVKKTQEMAKRNEALKCKKSYLYR